MTDMSAHGGLALGARRRAGRALSEDHGARDLHSLGAAQPAIRHARWPCSQAPPWSRSRASLIAPALEAGHPRAVCRAGSQTPTVARLALPAARPTCCWSSWWSRSSISWPTCVNRTGMIMNYYQLPRACSKARSARRCRSGPRQIAFTREGEFYQVTGSDTSRADRAVATRLCSASLLAVLLLARLFFDLSARAGRRCASPIPRTRQWYGWLIGKTSCSSIDVLIVVPTLWLFVRYASGSWPLPEAEVAAACMRRRPRLSAGSATAAMLRPAQRCQTR